MKTTTPKTRGGRRAGSGRKSEFPGKLKTPFAMMFTRVGRQALDDLVWHRGGSRNDAIEALLRQHPRAAIPKGGDPYPGKYPERMSIRLTAAAGAILDRLAEASGHGRGVVAEHLVRTYGASSTAPTASPRAPTEAPPMIHRPGGPRRSPGVLSRRLEVPRKVQ